MPWEPGAFEFGSTANPQPQDPSIVKTVIDAAGHKWGLTAVGEIYLDGLKDPNAKAADLTLLDGIAYHQEYDDHANWWWYDFTQKTWLVRVGLPPSTQPPTPIPPDPIPTPPTGMKIVISGKEKDIKITRRKTNTSLTVQMTVNKDTAVVIT